MQRPALRARGGGQRVELGAQPVDAQALPEDEERARDVLDRAPGLRGGGDDVGRLGELAPAGVRAGQLLGHAALGEPRDLLGVALAPGVVADVVERREQALEALAAGGDRRAEVGPGTVREIPARDGLDELVGAGHQLGDRAALDVAAELLDRLPVLAGAGHLAGDPERAHDV